MKSVPLWQKCGNTLLDYFQGLYLKLAAGNEATILAFAGWTLGIPGGFFQGEDEGTTIALQLGRGPANAQLRSLGDRSFAHEIEVALDPLVIEVADLPDFQMDLDDLLGPIAEGKIEGNFQDALGYRKFMHRIKTRRHSRSQNLSALLIFILSRQRERGQGKRAILRVDTADGCVLK